MAACWAWVGVVWLLGCSESWAPVALQTWQAELDAIHGHRLQDATPYVLPLHGEMIRFFCRWPDGASLPVFVPEEATPHEARAIQAALRAWQGAGLGIRFEPSDRDRAVIVFEFLEHDESARSGGTGSTLANCRVGEPSPDALGGSRLNASLASARIRIVRRETTEWREQDHAYFVPEVTGVVLHELAHALGFQGHARFGGGVLVPDTRETTRIGRRVLGGAPFADASLRALYRIPAGTVLGRHAIPSARTAGLDHLARLAPTRGMEGPYVRVGDRDGRVFWREPDGGEAGVVLWRVRRWLEQPERLVVLLEPRTQELLQGALDGTAR